MSTGQKHLFEATTIDCGRVLTIAVLWRKRQKWRDAEFQIFRVSRKCPWWGDTGSWFQKQGKAYQKELIRNRWSLAGLLTRYFAGKGMEGKYPW